MAQDFPTVGKEVAHNRGIKPHITAPRNIPHFGIKIFPDIFVLPEDVPLARGIAKVRGVRDVPPAGPWSHRLKYKRLTRPDVICRCQVVLDANGSVVFRHGRMIGRLIIE